MQRKILNKIQFPILVCVFALTLAVSTMFKKSINYIDAQTLAKDIYGVGKIKSERIVRERELNGVFLGEKDFYNRTKKLGIGEVVFNRIKKEYNLD